MLVRDRSIACLINVIDVESTCWADSPPLGQVSEIIDIGVCVIDVGACMIVDGDALRVKPTLSAISSFCTELTGISVAEASSGMTFAEACGTLESRHDSRRRAWLSWGDYDRKQFERDCLRKHVRYPFGEAHTNAKAVHSRKANGGRQMGMARALDAYGMTLEGRHHSGHDDAKNIGRLVLRLIADHGPESIRLASLR
jgi:inhibitor of KinA sporulation pathway (predicted exonuclease)